MALPKLVEKNGPEENLPLGHFVGKGKLIYAKCVCGEVVHAGKGRAGSWRGAVRHDSLGLVKLHGT
jgi:hypothetical protein